MSNDSTLNTIKDFKKQLQTIRTEFTKQGRQLIFAALNELVFSKYPDQLEYVSIIRYTPYWNDGEECNYGLHEASVLLKGLPNDDHHEYGDHYYKGKLTSQQLDLAIEIQSIANALLHSIPAEVFKDIFGDHQKNIFYPTGSYETKDYEHN